MRDRENDNFVFPHQVDNREGELLEKDAPSSMFVRSPCKRQRCRQFHGGFNGPPESFPESNLDSFVIGNTIQELKTRLAMKTRICHCVRRRASANTSAAGESAASPRSYSPIRRRISVSQAASTSGDDHSCNDSRSPSASCARSSGGRRRARSDNSESKLDIDILRYAIEQVYSSRDSCAPNRSWVPVNSI